MRFLPPLRYSIPTLLGALGLVLVLLAFFDGIQRSERLIESESRAQLLTLGTRIAARLEAMYASRDSRGVSEILIRTASEPHLMTAVIVDNQGNTLESSDNNFFGKNISEYASAWVSDALRESIALGNARESIDARGDTLAAVFPVALPPLRHELKSTRFAALYLHTDLSETKRLNFARHVERAWLMGAIVAIALAFVWFYFNWAVTERLERLSTAMQRIAVDHKSTAPIDVDGNDEVGRLAAGFGAMLREIQQQSGALSASEERHRSVIQALSEGIVMLDSKGTIIAANESASRIIGITRDELTSQSIFDPRWKVSNEDGVPMLPQDYPSTITLRTGEATKTSVIGVMRPDGERRWLSTHSAPIWLDSAGTERGAVSTVSDITERREAESQARRDRERLAAIVDSAMDGVISVDGSHRITVFNGAAERIFGRTEAEMLGRPIDALLPVRYRGVHLKYMMEFGERGVTRRSMGVPGQISGVRADGTEFPLEASIARVSVGGEPILTVMLRDISERVRAEEQRSQLEAQLRQSQKMQSLGTLTGGIAHDFNNILTAISGNVRLAIDDLPKTHPVQRSLLEIEKASMRATDLVRQVLAFGRRQEAQRVIVDLREVITDALSFLRAMIPTTIEIRTRFGDHLSKVAVDKTQVHQVITNLGSNAAHAIGDRPGLIEVKLDEVALNEDDAKRLLDIGPGRYVRVSFTDNGCGIESDLLDRVFEPFFTTKIVGQGTGLGLSVVHGIMNNHEGAITVRSTLGVGSRFELFFPSCSPDTNVSITDKIGSSPITKAGEGKTIVYVDDEEALVFLVTRILERQGYSVIGFNHPEQAVEAMARKPHSIDALISDLAMPGMTGFDVAREALAIRSDLPVILVSGYIRPQDIAAAQKLGIQRLILKPDTVDALAATLHELLAEQREIRSR